MSEQDTAPAATPAGDILAYFRAQLVQARADLRRFEHAEKVELARAEQRCIDKHGGSSKAIGENEADRKRALLLAVEDDPTYQAVRALHLEAQQTVDDLIAKIETLRDERHERELALREEENAARERLADAMLRVREPARGVAEIGVGC